MFLRKHWFGLSFLFVCGVIVSLFFILQPTPKAPIKIYKPVEPLEKPTAETPVTETPTQGGHSHADGTWHEGPQDVPPPRPEIADGQLPRKPEFIPTEDWQALSDDEKSRIRVIHDWTSWTDEERAQRDKEQNQLYIDEITNEPVFAEVYKLMTENEYPYSPEVQDKLSQAQMRVTHKLLAQAKVAAERRKKSLAEFYELEPEIAIKEAQER